MAASGVKSLSKIEQIVREQTASGAHEIKMPTIQPPSFSRIRPL